MKENIDISAVIVFNHSNYHFSVCILRNFDDPDLAGVKVRMQRSRSLPGALLPHRREPRPCFLRSQPPFRVHLNRLLPVCHLNKKLNLFLKNHTKTLS